jgi:hypothetical protein
VEKGLGFVRRDIFGEVIQFIRDATQNLRDVLLDSYICQPSRTVGLRVIMV